MQQSNGAGVLDIRKICRKAEVVVDTVTEEQELLEDLGFWPSTDTKTGEEI